MKSARAGGGSMVGWAAVAVAALFEPALAAGQEAPRIDTLAIRTHTRILAHDSMLGRDTGTPQGEVAARYIAAVCDSLGLLPLGGTYLQTVPLQALAVTAVGSRLVLTPRRGAPVRFSFPEDFIPIEGAGALRTGVRGTAVYVGSDGDVAGAPALPPTESGSIAITLGPVTRASAARLAAAGYAAMVALVPDEDVFVQFRAIVDGRSLSHADPSVTSSFLGPIPSVAAGPRFAAAFVEAAGGHRDARARDGVAVEIRVAVTAEPVTASNVACLLPGNGGGADEGGAITFTAHYDHLGVAPPDPAGDSIFNGFSDNAAGVGMLLSAAASLRHSEAPLRHPALFLFFTGEERGLLGSDYYVRYPRWPLERTAAVINLDAGAPPASPVSWRIAGGDSSVLGDLAVAVGEREGWTVTTSAARANSDYFPFWRAGVPAVLIVPGPEAYEGLSADSSDALRKRWDRYHQPGDEWAPDFPFDGLRRYAEYAVAVARELDRRLDGSGAPAFYRPRRDPGGSP